MRYLDRAEFEKDDNFGVGAPNDAYAQYFIGNSFLKPLVDPEKASVFLMNVTFEPGYSPRIKWRRPDSHLHNR
mgnify:CR=1 FL=1